MLEIVLVFAGNLSGSVNGAFTMTNAELNPLIRLRRAIVVRLDRPAVEDDAAAGSARQVWPKTMQYGTDEFAA
jgi:hypothetical protein